VNASHDSTAEVRLEHETEYRFRVDFDGGAPSIQIDKAQPAAAPAGSDPTALLGAAVGGCLASSFLFCVRKARIEPEGLAVRVIMTHTRDAHGRKRIGRIHARLEPRLTATDRTRFGRCLELFESYCTVAESVRDGIPIDLDIEPVREPSETAA
jgi:uncharacterized OsmC-like protein